MVLTNTQLIDILQKEFFMDTVLMHQFEVEIYLNILKNYLKNWPEWDGFGRIILKLQAKNDEEGIAKLLKEKYLKMKEYLSRMLDLAQELASDKVDELLAKERESEQPVVMEVEASFQQLQGLFYQHPVRGSIINAKNSTPPALHSPKRLTFESIVNWPGVKIEMSVTLDDKLLTYKRENLHKLTHTLVNKKLKEPAKSDTNLKSHVLIKLKKSCVSLNRDKLMDDLREMLKSEVNAKWTSVSGVLEKALIDELSCLPKVFNASCEFRRYLSKRKYVRYFVQDVNNGEDLDKYDLRLEEVVSPLCQYSFSATPHSGAKVDSITIACKSCQLTFKDDKIVCNILKHFSAVHMAEPDWTCMKCRKVYTMCSLTHTAWKHTCKRDE